MIPAGGFAGWTRRDARCTDSRRAATGCFNAMFRHTGPKPLDRPRKPVLDARGGLDGGAALRRWIGCAAGRECC